MSTHTQVATLEPVKLSLLTAMAKKYDMEAQTFANTLRATVVPKNITNEEFAAFLMVAKQYGLNPITKEIFAFPKQGGGIQPIVSVDGWANLINSQPQCDGVEFVDNIDDKGNLVSITCQIYRKDRSRPTTATEYMEECRRDTPTWKQWPRRMLRHKALIQAARYAFGFAGIVDPDEADRLPADQPALAPPPAPPVAHAKANGVAKPPAPIQVVEPPSNDAGDGEDDQMSDWMRDIYAELGSCATIEAVEDLRDRALPDLEDDYKTAWKDACAERATTLFAGVKKRM